METDVPLNPPSVIVTGTASDSHTWNLVYLQLLLEELGRQVSNLGPCMPDDELVDVCRRAEPALIVLSSVNGHGVSDGLRVVRRLREQSELAATPIVIGGKLGITGADSSRHNQELLDAGFDEIFDEAAGIGPFRSFVTALGAGESR
jgi:methylaspartate mutase sigma subunit